MPGVPLNLAQLRRSYILQKATALNLEAPVLLLDDNVLLDMIFPLLDIPDLFCVRRTCKRFYYLTHQPSLWLKILKWLPLPISPLPPTARYAYSNLSSLETERLVCRALSLPATWISNHPASRAITPIQSFYDVLSAKFAPGGQFLVASVKDLGPNGYALLIFVLDHRQRGCYPLAKVPCESKAYGLEVKYMRIKGQLGLTIAYVRREPAKRKHREEGRNVSDYSDVHEIDFDIPVRYEIEVLHSSLASLQELSDPRYPPGSDAFRASALELDKPFLKLARIRSTEPLEHVALGEMGGQPFVAAARRMNRLIVKNLETGITGKLDLLPNPQIWPIPNSEYKIRGVRILPHERQVFIVRTFAAPPDNPFQIMLAEKYKLPLQGTQESWAAHTAHIFPVARAFTEITISDPNITPSYDVSAAATRAPYTEPPGPLSIYAVSVEPQWGLVHMRIPAKRRLTSELEVNASPIDPLPSSTPPAPPPISEDNARTHRKPAGSPSPPPLKDTGFEFSLSETTDRIHDFAGNPTQIVHVLPGSRHSLIYTTPIDCRRVDPPVISMEALSDHAYAGPQDDPDPRWPQDKERREAAAREMEWAVRIAGGKRSEDRVCAPLDLGEGGRTLLEEMSEGVVCVAWEEWSGRLVIVPSGFRQELRLVEFAAGPVEDENGHRIVPVPDVDNRYRLPHEVTSPDYVPPPPSPGILRLNPAIMIYDD